MSASERGPRTSPLVGRRLVNVAGESHYQEALRALAPAAGEGEVRVEAEAVLAPEPGNRFDPNAVQVLIEGRLVGYLPRAEALAYAQTIKVLADRGRLGACEALIAGRAGTGTSNLGVFLRLPDPGEPPLDADPGRRR